MWTLTNVIPPSCISFKRMALVSLKVAYQTFRMRSITSSVASSQPSSASADSKLVMWVLPMMGKHPTCSSMRPLPPTWVRFRRGYPVFDWNMKGNLCIVEDLGLTHIGPTCQHRGKPKLRLSLLFPKPTRKRENKQTHTHNHMGRQ